MITNGTTGTRVTINDQLKALRRMQSELGERAEYLQTLADSGRHHLVNHPDLTGIAGFGTKDFQRTHALTADDIRAEAEECRSMARILAQAEGEICSD